MKNVRIKFVERRRDSEGRQSMADTHRITLKICLFHALLEKHRFWNDESMSRIGGSFCRRCDAGCHRFDDHCPVAGSRHGAKGCLLSDALCCFFWLLFSTRQEGEGDISVMNCKKSRVGVVSQRFQSCQNEFSFIITDLVPRRLSSDLRPAQHPPTANPIGCR